MSTSALSQNLLAIAEEQFKQGNVVGAVEIMETLTMQLPNSSKRHMMLSRYLVAYSAHVTFSQNGSHYEILRISDPACDQERINRKYKEIFTALYPMRNVSAAAKSALKIFRSAWSVLSDPERRRVYDIEKGFVTTMGRRRGRFFLRDDEPQTQAVRPSRELLEFLD